jgi:hypothetical protein
MNRCEGLTLEGLTPPILGQACRTFLTLAYPDGPATIPAARSVFWDLPADANFDALLKPPVCALLKTAEGRLRGYSFRLGSATYPHVKLQVVCHEEKSPCIFSVDTHDALHLDPDHPDAPGWAKLQLANRQLKVEVEHAWEAQGLLTFNGLLRKELEKDVP